MTVAPVDYETILQLIYQLPVRQRFTLVHDVLQSIEPSLSHRAPTLAEDRQDEDETKWLYAASRNPAFHSLYDPAEDIYSITDGEPVHADEV